jgi:hypothetical protein
MRRSKSSLFLFIEHDSFRQNLVANSRSEVIYTDNIDRLGQISGTSLQECTIASVHGKIDIGIRPVAPPRHGRPKQYDPPHRWGFCTHPDRLQIIRHGHMLSFNNITRRFKGL